MLLTGDSAHAIFVNLDAVDLATYLNNRQSHGFNAVWVQALCSDYISNCRNDLSTYDGIKPFTSGTNQTDFDVSTQNPDYWARIDSYVKAASAREITILFDTWETGALMPVARTNGNIKMRNFGAFLGNRYKNFDNILWITGNDFQTWTDAEDNALIQNLMAGITSADMNLLHTTQLNFYASGSLDNALLAPYIDLAGAYDYYCSYGQTLSQYNKPTTTPVFFEEGYYEYQDFVFGNIFTPLRLRTQAWWAALAGANAGQVFGSENIYPFNSGWQTFLDSTGVVEFGNLNSFLKSIAWYDLVPDQAHVIVTAGYSTPDTAENPACNPTNDYVTTASLADGTASVSYTPAVPFLPWT
jgi:hypothetical protein